MTVSDNCEFYFLPSETPSSVPTQRRYVWEDGIEAELDDENQSIFDEPVDSVMGQYLKAVHNRMQAETTSTPERLNLDCIVGDKWLLRRLRDSNWWLRASSARSVCLKLGLEFGEESYYRDIRIWLPDEEFGIKPPCVDCGQSDQVSSHCFRDNHFGRRITHLTENYFVISKRYSCKRCQDEAVAAKLAATERALAAGLEVVAGDVPQITFMGWDARSVALLPHGYGDEFPAFLTWRGGVDKVIIDLMRPLCDKGDPPPHTHTQLENHLLFPTVQYS